MSDDPIQGRLAGGQAAGPDPPGPKLLDSLFELPRSAALGCAAVLILVTLWADSMTRLSVSLGLLYMIPIVVGSLALRRWEILLLAAICGVLREHFGPNSWEPLALARLASTLVTFGVIGLLVGELARNRRLQLGHVRALRDEIARRKEAEDELRMLVESSPAAIVTADSAGRIELANQAAHSVLGAGHGGLEGRLISEFLPALADLHQADGPGLQYRTTTNCRGRRADGTQFLASVWFTTFGARSGRKLAAIFTDNSEDLRDQQESSLESLLRSTRVLVGSVSHEIRNVCAAIAVVHANLARIPGVTENEDYAALSTLAQGLSRLAAVELQSANEQDLPVFQLANLLEEFRIVMQPALEEQGIELEFHGAEEIPLLNGDHHSLLQVLLNLARNSIRAMEDSAVRRIIVEASMDGPHALVRFRDTGPGVAHPERMFRAFQEGADSVGLGLFVSRSLVRASGGELYHEPGSPGCTLCMRLRAASAQEQPSRLLTPEMHA